MYVCMHVYLPIHLSIYIYVIHLYIHIYIYLYTHTTRTNYVRATIADGLTLYVLTCCVLLFVDGWHAPPP